MLSTASVLQSRGVRLIVIAIGPRALEPQYRKVLEAIPGEELFSVHDYDQIDDVVSNITALICRKCDQFYHSLYFRSTARGQLFLRKPIITNLSRLKFNQRVYFSTHKCCSTLLHCKILQERKSVLKTDKKQQKKFPPKS